MRYLGILIIFLANQAFGQVLYIKERPDADKGVLEKINTLRDSVGLPKLKESAELDSAAKHHAYYLAYCLAIEKWGSSHKEIYDIPNFEEKKTLQDRGCLGEIQCESGISISSKDFIKYGTNFEELAKYKIAKKLRISDSLSLTPQQEIINCYIESKYHYGLMMDKIGKGYYGSFTLVIIVHIENEKIKDYLYIINVVDFK